LGLEEFTQQFEKEVAKSVENLQSYDELKMTVQKNEKAAEVFFLLSSQFIFIIFYRIF